MSLYLPPTRRSLSLPPLAISSSLLMSLHVGLLAFCPQPHSKIIHGVQFFIQATAQSSRDLVSGCSATCPENWPVQKLRLARHDHAGIQARVLSEGFLSLVEAIPWSTHTTGEICLHVAVGPRRKSSCLLLKSSCVL